MLTISDSNMAANSICHAAEGVKNEMIYAYCRPSTVHKPRLFIDGDQWCALLGENLQDGVAGFGDSPEKAMVAFDVAWGQSLKVR